MFRKGEFATTETPALMWTRAVEGPVPRVRTCPATMRMHVRTIPAIRFRDVCLPTMITLAMTGIPAPGMIPAWGERVREFRAPCPVRTSIPVRKTFAFPLGIVPITPSPMDSPATGEGPTAVRVVNVCVFPSAMETFATTMTAAAVFVGVEMEKPALPGNASWGVETAVTNTTVCGRSREIRGWWAIP